ncbi:MAG: AI-2E family transporter [Gemmatimonadetes bacterium]|nr:MAG: AI-2E family transporter [Gemmatimonadota bacterium]
MPDAAPPPGAARNSGADGEARGHAPAGEVRRETADGARGHETGPWGWALAGLAVLALGLYLTSLRGLLSPFLLYWVVVALLLPFRGRPGHALLVGVATVLGLVWLLATTGFLVAPFVLGLLLAYMLDPLVDRIQARGVGRSLAILILIAPVGAAVLGGVLFGVPAVAGEVQRVIDASPLLLDRFAAFVGRAAEWLDRVPGVDSDALVERLQAIRPEDVVGYLRERHREITQGLVSGIVGVGRGLSSLVSVVGYVFLAPVLAFYLLRDYDGIVARARALVPRPKEEAVVSFAREYDYLLSRYLRGQLTVALLLGVLTAVGLFLVGFPYALLLGSLVGVLSLVPYLGLALSLIPAVAIALMSGDVLWSLIKLAGVFGVTQVLEGTVISPRIVGESVGLHPVWVVLALSIGGFFLGFAGFLLAVPVAVGVKLLVQRGVVRYTQSSLYRGDG